MSEPASTWRRVWKPAFPVDIDAIWGPLRRGAGDPAWREAHATIWRALRTAAGPVTLAVRTRRESGVVQAQAWSHGEAGEVVLESLPTMLGADDEWHSAFRPRHDLLRYALRRHPGWRVPSTGLVWESLMPAILEQKVTSQEAFGGWRRIVSRYGQRAPGPGARLGLMVPPGPAVLRTVPSWEWLAAGISPQRSDTVLRAVAVADRLEGLASLGRTDPAAAARRLMSVPGIGTWTAAETAHRAWGDADAVSFGDYHVAADLGWALTGRAVDDVGLADILQPYDGHRYRVQRLLELIGAHRPRRAPRMGVRTHLPTRRG